MPGPRWRDWRVRQPRPRNKFMVRSETRYVERRRPPPPPLKGSLSSLWRPSALSVASLDFCWRDADVEVAGGRAALSRRCRRSRPYQTREVNVGRGILLYLLGVPIP